MLLTITTTAGNSHLVSLLFEFFPTGFLIGVIYSKIQDIHSLKYYMCSECKYNEYQRFVQAFTNLFITIFPLNSLGITADIHKKIILLLSVLFSGITFAAQPLSGTYKNGSDSLKFEGNQIVFRVSGFGGLSSSQAGAGTYELIDDFLLVHTGDYPGNKSTFQELPGSRADTCVVKVVGLSNYPVEEIGRASCRER